MVNQASKIKILNPAALTMFCYSPEDTLFEFDQICPGEIPERGKRKDVSTFPSTLPRANVATMETS
jgi:hypothetical protein